MNGKFHRYNDLLGVFERVSDFALLNIDIKTQSANKLVGIGDFK